MKVSVFKANKAAANDLWESVSKITNSKGQPVFTRIETPENKGFEIHAPYEENGAFARNEQGKLKRNACFKFTNDPAPMIKWDETRIDVDI